MSDEEYINAENDPDAVEEITPANDPYAVEEVVDKEKTIKDDGAIIATGSQIIKNKPRRQPDEDEILKAFRE